MTTLVVCILIWLLFAALANLLVRGPRPDPGTGAAFLLVRVYAALRHGLRVAGRENIPPSETLDARPLIVVANHTSGVDPLLVQVALPGIFIRWVMGRDMCAPVLDWFWRFAEVIAVDRTGGTDHGAMRAMLAHLTPGSVLGLFPEGRIPPAEAGLGVFQPGLGLLLGRSGALVLPVVITGTPRAPTAWEALRMTSRSTVTIMPVIDYRGRKPAEAIADLQRRYAGWLGVNAGA